MKAPTAPIRFLMLAVGGWIGFRVAAWMPGPAPDILPDAVAEALPVGDAATFPAPAGWTTAAPTYENRARADQRSFQIAAVLSPIVLAPPRTGLLTQTSVIAVPAAPAGNAAPPAGFSIFPPLPASPPPALAANEQGARRWSASAWLFLREDAGSGLAPGGTLGGSQAGARFTYRLNDDARRPLSLSGRAYAAVDRPAQSEFAFGVDWQPVASVPVHILAERRQRIGRDGRSDFGLTLYGGGERQLLGGRARVEAYGQAGIGGLEERDLFADGAVRAGVRIGPAEVGGGAWAGAQPGVSRLDVGPQITFRLPVGRGGIRASADYRFRIAGDAAPSSGPALTIATDF